MAEPQEKIVEIPGVGNVAFPAGMSDQDMANAAAKYHAASKSREDATAVGVNYDWIANQASKLPRPLQYPAAFAGSLIGTAVETLSDPLTIASLGATAGAGRVPSAPAGVGPRPSLPTGWVPAAKAAVKEVASDIPLVRKFGPAAQAGREAYQAARTLEANPPRLVKGAKTLTESLQEALQDVSERGMKETFERAPSPSESLPGAAPGGAQAGADTMAMLKARGQPPVVPTGKAAEILRGQQEMAHPGAQRFLAREIPENRPIAQPIEREAARFGSDQGARTVGDLSPSLAKVQARAGGGPGVAVTPGEAQSAILKAARSAKMTLTADETVAARQMVQQGHPPEDVLNALAGLRRLTQGLPTDAEMAATVAEKNTRTTHAKGGTKIGRFEVVEE